MPASLGSVSGPAMFWRWGNRAN